MVGEQRVEGGGFEAEVGFGETRGGKGLHEVEVRVDCW